MSIVTLAALLLLVWSVAVVAQFKRSYAGHIALRALALGEISATPATLGLLRRDVLRDRFDAADAVFAIEALVANGMAGDALAAFAVMVRKDPENPDLQLLYGDWLSAEKRHQEAERAYLLCMQLAPPDRPDLSEETLLLRMAKNAASADWHDKVLSYYAQYLKKRPDSARTRIEYAEFLVDLNKPELAMEQYALLLKAAPGDIRLHMARAQAAVAAERLAAAVAECKEVLKIDPGNRDALVTRARSELAMGGPVSDRSELESLAGRRRRDRGLTRVLARAYLRDQEYHPATILFRKLRPETLADAEVSQWYAEALTGFRRPTHEDTALMNTLSAMVAARKPANRPVPLLAAVARGLVVTGAKQRAAAFLGEAVRRSPADRRLRMELVGLLQDLGRHEEATKHYRALEGASGP